MTISISNTHGRTFSNPKQATLPTVARVVISCTTAGETAYVSANSLLVKGFQFGATFQALAALNVALTSDPEELAVKNAAGVKWYAWKTFAANEMAAPGILFTAMKITFTAGPNELVILSA